MARVAKRFPFLRCEPDDFDEWDLLELDEPVCRRWLTDHLEKHRDVFPPVEAYCLTFADLKTRFDGLELGELLRWIPGKNLLAAIASRAPPTGVARLDAGDLRAEIRDWIRQHPEQALARVPEWARLAELLDAEP